MSLRSLTRGSRSRRIVVCGATAAAVALVPGVALAEAPAATDTATSASPTADPAAAPTSDPSSPVTAGTTTAPETTAPETTAPETVAPAPVAPAATAPETTPAPVAPAATAPTSGAAPVQPLGGVDPSALDPAAFDPAALAKLFTPVCTSGTLTGLSLQLGQLSGLLDQLKAAGVPVGDMPLPGGGTGTVDLPLDDATLGELTAELNASSAEFADLGDLDATDLEGLPAAVQADVRTVLGGLESGTLQPAAVRTLLQDVVPCPAVPAGTAPADTRPVSYLGYAPTGGSGPDGGSPLALLGGGAALLAGGGLLTTSLVRGRGTARS